MYQKEIIKVSKNLGINLIGFTQLKYFEDLENTLKKQGHLNYKTSFQIGNIEDKVFKSNKYKDMKSAIVFGISYNKGDKVYSKAKSDEVYLSSYCWGKDYHVVLKQKLEEIKKIIVLNKGKAKIFVDNNELDERFLAREAGLGFFGLNNLLINEKFGSYFFIGIILTDLIFEYDERNDKKCFMCGKCIEACPTGAINNSGVLDGKKCLSYLTQKKVLTESEEKSFNKSIFGCDICSLVCPHNYNLKSTNNFKFTGIELIKINEFKKLSEEEFNSIYKDNACFWRGKKVLDRNIEIVEEKIDKRC